MNPYTFEIFGHENTTALHKTTLEFTKDEFLTPQGDCIIGVKSNYRNNKLLEFRGKRIEIKFIHDGQVLDSIVSYVPNIISLSRKSCIVIRKSDYIDNRTFATESDKSAKDINRKIIELLTHKDNSIQIEISEKK